MAGPDSSSQYAHLLRHFFGRFFDFEAISSPQADIIERNVLTFQILALLILPGVLKSLFLYPKYGYYIYRPVWQRDLASLTDKCFFLSLSMILLGFITVFEWDMLFPDRKDYLNLTCLPVAARTVFFAKLGALAKLLLVITAAIDLCPTFFFPGAVLANNAYGYKVMLRNISFTFGLRYIASHAISMLLGNTFIFLSVISLQGLILALAPGRWGRAVSRWMRFFTLLLFLAALFTFAQVSPVDRLIHGAHPFVGIYPPVWFVGIYEVLIGTKDPVLWKLAGRAGGALVFVGCLSALTYVLCYRRFLRRTIEVGGSVSYRRGGMRATGNRILNRWLVRRPESRASYHFVGQTIFRSGRHSLHIATYFAVGLAIAAVGAAPLAFSNDTSVVSLLESTLLSVPLTLSFFLLVGMRMIFAIPVDLEANWLFRLAPIRRIEHSHAGVRLFLIGAVILPIHGAAAFVYALVWDWSTALQHAGFGISVSVLLMELLIFRLPKIPFTCSYLSGAARIVTLFPLYFLGFCLFAYGLANLETLLVGHAYGIVSFYGLAAATWVLLRRGANSSEIPIRFEEVSEDKPILLDLKN